MKKTRIIFPIILLIFAFLAFNYSTSFIEESAPPHISGFRLKNFSMNINEIDIQLKIGLLNPSDNYVRIEDAELKLRIKGLTVATSELEDAISIPPHGEKEILTDFQISDPEMMNVIIDELSRSSSLDINLTISGNYSPKILEFSDLFQPKTFSSSFSAKVPVFTCPICALKS